MCYPCIQCNSCGKFDNELFAYMRTQPALRCLACGTALFESDVICPSCRAPVPPAPGISSAQIKTKQIPS